jgi:hypothetical protein
MRHFGLAAGTCLALICAGCDVRNFWRDDVARINAAIPLKDSVTRAKSSLDEMLANDSALKERLQREFVSRLEVRAMQCVKEDLSVWDSGEDIRAKLNKACMDGADDQLRDWVQAARLRVLVGMPPLRPVPASPPALIATANVSSVVGAAAEAPIMAIASRRRFEVLDAATGKTLHLEQELPAAPYFLEISPNGRVIAMDEQGSVILRDATNGEVLARYPGQRKLVWLDSSAALLTSQDLNTRSLLDLHTGTMAPAQGLSVFPGTIAQISRKPPRFAAANLHRIIKFELRSDESGAQIVVLEQRDAPVPSASNGSLTATFDGKHVVRTGGRRFLISDTEKLGTEMIDTDPFNVLEVCPLEDPNELLFKGTITGSRQDLFYIYSVDDGGLSPVEDERLTAPGGYANHCSIRFPAFNAVYVQSAGVFKRFDNVGRGAKFHAGAWAAHFGEIAEAQRIQMEEGRERSALAASGYATRPATKAVLGDIAGDSMLFALGVYEAANSSRGTGQFAERWPGPVTVIVRPADKPIVLVLSSYEAVTWRLNVMAGARLKAVLLGGYKESKVDGAGDVRVVAVKGYAYEQGSNGFRALDDEALRWTGRRIDSFQGRYSASTFLVGGR